MYQPIESARLYEQIVEQIEQRILKGELHVGDQLPPERDLGEQFGVSRTAVREAVKALRQKGLLETYPGRGTFITNGTSQAMRHSLNLVVNLGRAHGSDDLVQVREILEPEIAALAAKHVTSEQLAAMDQAVAAMDGALDDAERFIEADLDFHLALAEATRNDVIPILIDSIVDLLREQRKSIFFTPGGPQRGQIHHKRILKAVKQQNPDAARKAMRAHLAQVRQDSRHKTPVR
jgi:GntR family transcriptional regulator, transcriptional repressor for pyruvate dehydrogenase complex